MKANFYTIHIFQTSNSKEFLDKKLVFLQFLNQVSTVLVEVKMKT